MESNLNRGDYCENISNESGLSISSLKYEMNKSQVALLDNKEYKFNSISNSVFGNLVTNDVEIIDESRLEGTIRFEIKDFTKFRYSFSKFFFFDQWFLVNNIPWLIGVEMNEIDNDIYLEILSKPIEQTKEFLESNPINTDIIINMIRTDGELFGQKICVGLFNNLGFAKIVKFISLKDIMNPFNSIYNEQTDLIRFEAKIKIID